MPPPKPNSPVQYSLIYHPTLFHEQRNERKCLQIPYLAIPKKLRKKKKILVVYLDPHKKLMVSVLTKDPSAI